MTGPSGDFPYDLPCHHPLKDALPMLTAPRGGIVYNRSPSYSSLTPMRRRWLRIKNRAMRPWVYRLRSTYTHWRDDYRENDDW